MSWEVCVSTMSGREDSRNDLREVSAAAPQSGDDYEAIWSPLFHNENDNEQVYNCSKYLAIVPEIDIPGSSPQV